ncbi:MAG TPA: hypothetical protein VN580_13545 [Clostridia bacterium]|nr:hypothetical protein [Clostridia bacterium]
MFRRIFLVLLAVAMALPLTACVMDFDNAGGIISGVAKEYKEAVELSDKYRQGQPIELKLDMKMAKAAIDSTEDKLAEVEFMYGNEALKPEFTVEEDSISIRNRIEKLGLGKPVNKWEVNITDRLPLEVELDSDASDVKLDMSRMIIDKLSAQINASSAKLYFDEPNKGSVDKLRINANASDVNIYGAGNIGFGVLALDSNASKVSVDLTGENREDAEIRIDANASTVRLKLPEDIGVRIVADKYELSSIKIDNDNLLSRSEKEYVTKDYDKAGRTLKIYADLKLTTLNIE